jgi:sugar lactone lactonase YvrE
MQTTLKRLTSPVGSLAATSLALFSVLALCLGVTPANAAVSLPIATSSNTTIGYFPAGGQEGSQIPISESFVVGPNGHAIMTDEWGGDVLEIDPTQPVATSVTKLAALSNGGPTGIDSYGNVYVAADGYSGTIFKIPYNAATGKYTGFTTAPTTNCVGTNQDASPCVYAASFAAVFTNGSGYADLVFDGSGNLIIATSTVPSDNPNTIYLCNASCQTGSGAPTKIYADPNPIGALAVDPWGNLFFSDGNNSTGKVTNLNELPLVSGTYASAPTVLESYTNSAGYGNGFSGVAVSGTGTVYFATNADGIYAIPNTQSGGPNLAGTYALAVGGGYAVALDAKGNLFMIHYAGSPPSGSANYGVDKYLINNVPLAATTIGGTATTATVNILDSNGSCSPNPPTLTLTPQEFGVATSEYTVTPGASCGAALGTGNGTFSPALTLTGAVTSATITFNPASVGARNAALVIADTTNSATGVAALSGIGQGAMASLDPGAQPNGPFTGFSGPTSVVGDAAGNVIVADSSAGKVYEIPSGSTTPTSIGSGFVNPSALTFDANGNLYIADDGLPGVLEIANAGTAGAFVAGTESTVVSNKATPGGTALGSATGLAIGPGGYLYISDPVNKRVILYNPLTSQAVVTLANTSNGITTPMGLAVDGASNLYVADSGANKIFEVSSTGAVSSIVPPNVTQASGVAVDGSGSILVADAGSGSIVLIPNSSGTLDTTKAATVETVGTQASSLWMDPKGNLFSASASGKSAYAIMRGSASVNLGTVQDGLTNSATVFLENSGNAAATLATPVVTEPTNTMFTLNPATTNGCSAGSSGPAGAFCQMVATFAPPPGTADGVQTGSGSINVATPALTLTVNMTGTATQSSIQPQTITGFTPPAALQVGQQITLSATGGASGNPVTFSIDAGSACPTCATITGNILTAVAVGVVKVDANQAGGQANGNQYAAATQVQVAITISNNLVAAGVPALSMHQINWSYQSGAFTDGQNPAGGSFAVTQNGLIVVGTSYNNKADFVNASTGALVNQVAINGPGGFTIDSQNNLYMSHLYGPSVLKIPYVNGAYATLTDSTPAACTGNDTTLCTVASAPSGGVKAIAFDPSGNLYMVAVPASPGTSAIYVCPASCQTGGTATTLYSDANAISQIAFDPWGNLFFTEGVYTSSGNFGNLESSSSNLYELKYTAGTGYATTPTLLQTLTIASPAAYDNQLDGVAVTSNGTIYYATQNEGTFGIPNTQAGGPDPAHQFVVSTLGAKGMELDAQGNEWVVVYHSGGDNIGEALLGDLTTPDAQYNGAPVTASATVVDNAFGCGTAATLAIASSNPEFAATAGTTCSTVSANFTTAVSGSTYPATITFTATKPNSQSATLTVSDTTNGGQGTATITGFALTTPQNITFTAPTITTYTYAPGLTVNVSVKNGGSNNPAVFTVDPTSTGAGTFSSTTVTGTTSSATMTVTQAGNIVIDANEPGGLVNGTYYDAGTQQLPITVNKATQTINFLPLQPVTYASGLTVTLNAAGGASTSAVVFTIDASSTGQGSISGNVLSVTQAGSFVIDANQAADANFSAAPQVQQVLVVNQASQTITFTPIAAPLHYIASCPVLAQCAMVSIQATGGATNNAIAISSDPTNAVAFTLASSTTSASGVTTATLVLLPSQSLVFPAKLVIDANQQGNVNYAAATQAQFTVNVLGPLPLQTITWANPGTQIAGNSLTLSAMSSAGAGYPVAFTSNTPSVCTVNGTKATFVAASSATGGCTITASQPGDNVNFAAAIPLTQTFAVNAAGQTPSMNMNLSLTSLTIQPGTVGLTQITVNSVNNFASSGVNFTCTGLPAGYSCSFNPSSTVAFTPTGTNGLPGASSASTTLTVTTPSTAALERHNLRPFFPATLAVALCFLGFKKRSRLRLLLLLVALFAGLGVFSACGGSSTTTTTSKTSTVTITATPAPGMSGASASVQTTATLTVIAE